MLPSLWNLKLSNKIYSIYSSLPAADLSSLMSLCTTTSMQVVRCCTLAVICHLSIEIEILAQSPGWEMNFHVPGDQHCLSSLNRQPVLAYYFGFRTVTVK